MEVVRAAAWILRVPTPLWRFQWLSAGISWWLISQDGHDLLTVRWSLSLHPSNQGGQAYFDQENTAEVVGLQLQTWLFGDLEVSAPELSDLWAAM